MYIMSSVECTLGDMFLPASNNFMFQGPWKHCEGDGSRMAVLTLYTMSLVFIMSKPEYIDFHSFPPTKMSVL